METRFDHKTWLDYVTKLNDREIRKKSSNGLTVWALVGVMGISLFRIIDEFNVIFENSKSISITVIFFSIVLNILIVLNFSIKRITPTDSNRSIITNIDGQGMTISSYTVSLLVILLIVSNYYAAILSYQGQLLQWSFCILSIYYFINLLGLVVFKFKWRNTKLKIEPHTELRTKWIISLSNWSILSSMTLISIREVLIHNLVLSNLGLLKVALELTAIIICLLMLSSKYIRSLKYVWLEVFERNIISGDLSVEQIRTKFIEGFLGKGTLDWLREAQKEIESKNETIQSKIQELENNFLEDNDEELEINEALDILELNTELIIAVQEKQKEYTEYILLKTEEIKSFSSLGILEKDEKGYIDLIKKEWDSIYSLNKKLLEGVRHKMGTNTLFLEKVKAQAKRQTTAGK